MRRNARLPRQARGAVMIMVALLAAVLIGFIGLTVDLGRLFVTKTELQTAVDACALAAAQELRPGVTPPDALALTRAANAGVAAGNRNLVGFQAAAAGLTTDEVLFSENLSNGTSAYPFGYVAGGAANPATARYAMCGHTQGGITAWFVGVLDRFLGITPAPASVGAWAVATLASSQSNCAVPLGVCEKGAAPTFGLNPGDWVSGKFSSGSTGNFNWIDFSPPSGGASELSALLTSGGQCNLSVNNPVGQTGVDQSVANAWNTRFGIYNGGGNGGGNGNGGGSGNQSLTSAPPDYTGYAYTPKTWSGSAFADFQARRAVNAAYQGIAGINVNNATIATPTDLAAHGGGRRIVTAPIINCGGWASAQTVPVEGWACVLILNPVGSPSDTAYMEILGLANTPGSPCATSGLAGGSNGPLVPVLVQ
ncbi:MAG: TadE/TadG family type IV pilus assembly protein [Ignavibacteria bacterium]